MTVSAKIIYDLAFAIRHRKLTTQPNSYEKQWANQQAWNFIEEIIHLLMSKDGRPPTNMLEQTQLDEDVSKFVDATRYSTAGYIDVKTLLDNMREVATETVGLEVERGIPLEKAQANFQRSLYRIEQLDQSSPRSRINQAIYQGSTQQQSIPRRTYP